jgi:8-oxo-dGTP pyrophosphatase MutT (NUDIX family)
MITKFANRLLRLAASVKIQVLCFPAESYPSPMFDPTNLAAALTHPLPGSKISRRMAPELAYGRHAGPAGSKARQAAVLVLLYPVDHIWHLLLTVRPTAMGTHAGQVCFPGGAIEPLESAEEAALREFAEEVGGETSGLETIGRLTPLFVFNSNFHVTPCVAIGAKLPELHPSPSEVAAVLQVPVEHLANRVNHDEILIERRGLSFTAPCYCFEERRIWGATAIMIAELLAVIERSPT